MRSSTVLLILAATGRASSFLQPFAISRRLISHTMCARLEDDDEADDDVDPFDMSQLQSRIEQQQNQYLDLLMSTSSDEETVRPENVHIIVFNPGTEEQGVHTIEFPKGSGLNIILAFESQPECENFAAMLKQEGSLQFQNAVPSESPLEELEQFCETIGVLVEVVPQGKDLRPPSDNVDDLSFDPMVDKNRQTLDQLMFDEEDDSEDDDSMDPNVEKNRQTLDQLLFDSEDDSKDDDSMDSWQ
jgi:hypothetical protein